MADNFDEKLEQVKNMLKDENVANKISNFLDSLNNNQNSNENTEFDTEEFETSAPSSNESFDQTLGNNVDALSKITRIYNTLNDTNNQSANLLMAIKPFLNSKRQGKLDNAARVLNFSKLPNMVRTLEKD